jgi:hypothetical protein
MKLGRNVALFAGLSTLASVVRPQVVLDKNEWVHETVTGERDCGKADWQFALFAQTSGPLKSESPLTHTCRAVSLPWLPTAQIIQVTGVRQIDVFVSITFVRATEESPIRIITALGGLVEKRERENDAANKAVFNELLRIAAYKPTEGQMLDIAILYLFMVGHPPDESAKPLEDVLKSSDMLGFVDKENGWTEVTVHRRRSLYGNPSKKWRLRFRTDNRGVELVSVVPE